MKNMLVVAGARSGIGKAYIDYFQEDSKVIGITRTEQKYDNENITNLVCDLTNKDESEKLFGKIDFSRTARVLLVHTVGVDIFECKTYPKIKNINTINPVIYSTNVNTLKNVCDGLIEKLSQYRNNGKNIALTIVMFGAISDKYNIPFFISFRESKKISKLYIENLTRKYNWVKGFVVNVSTVKTNLTTSVRPYADTKYWLLPKEVVDKSVDKILNQKEHFEEIEIFKFDPNFESDYYFNNDKIYKKWIKEMYG